MKVLFIGGIKSGKSAHAEARALELSPNKKPYYLATTEPLDEEMKERILRHKAQRADRFITVEEPLHMCEALSGLEGAVLVECLTLWINNMLYREKSENEIYEELRRLLSLQNDAVFVINEVGGGIIPDNPLARRFADISGRVAQMVAAACDEVYLCAAGLALRMK